MIRSASFRSVLSSHRAHPGSRSTRKSASRSTRKSAALVRAEQHPTPSLYDVVDEEKMLRESTFPIKPEELIELTKNNLRKVFANIDLAEDFEFIGPVVGPLSKETFVNAVAGFQVNEGEGGVGEEDDERRIVCNYILLAYYVHWESFYRIISCGLFSVSFVKQEHRFGLFGASFGR